MRWVNFDGPETLINQFADVLVTEALRNSLRGQLVGADGKQISTECTEITASGAEVPRENSKLASFA
jgi:hypothetical protein